MWLVLVFEKIIWIIGVIHTGGAMVIALLIELNTQNKHSEIVITIIMIMISITLKKQY